LTFNIINLSSHIISNLHQFSHTHLQTNKYGCTIDQELSDVAAYALYITDASCTLTRRQHFSAWNNITGEWAVS